MKWLIRIAGFLVTAAVFTALRYSDIFLRVGSVGTGLITAAVFYFGVYFIPDRLIRRMDAKRAHDAPAVPDAPAADAPEEICAYPMMKQASSAQDAPAAPSPKEEKAPERRPIRPYNSGYVLVILFLSVCLLISVIASAGNSSKIQQLQLDLSESYNEGYRDAENDNQEAADNAYNEGYANALGTVDFYSSFSSGFAAGSRSSGTLTDWNECASAYDSWYSGLDTQSFSEWSDAKKALEAIQEKYGS